MLDLLQTHHRPIQALLKAARPDQDLFLVGGAVRDWLLGKPLHDLDFTVSQPVKPLARAMAADLNAALFALDEGRGAYRVVEIHPDGSRFTYDLTALRGADLPEDLQDRDFTFNAIAMDLRHPDRSLDPLGGAQDLKDRTLRACTPHSFKNDPLRVLRAVRHSVQFQSRIEPQTLQWLKAAIPGLARISMERQRDELMKILAGPRPAVAIRLLDQLGILPYLIPELSVLKGVQQSPPHTLNVWEHTLAVLAALEMVMAMLAEPFSEEKKAGLWLGMASQRLGRFRPQLGEYIQMEIIPERPRRGLIFLAALLHDLGKPEVRTQDEDGRIHFYAHEQRSMNRARGIARRLKLAEEEGVFLQKVVGDHMRLHFLAKTGQPPSRRSIYRFFQSAGPAGPAVVLHTLADTLGTYGVTLSQTVWQAELDAARSLLEAWFENPEESVSPPRIVTGNDMIQELGIQPGPGLGQILAIVQEKQACGEITTRQQAMDLAKELLDQGLLAEGDPNGPEVETR